MEKEDPEENVTRTEQHVGKGLARTLNLALFILQGLLVEHDYSFRYNRRSTLPLQWLLLLALKGQVLACRLACFSHPVSDVIFSQDCDVS
eukprot:1907680-Amphidinium_carterae.2